MEKAHQFVEQIEHNYLELQKELTNNTTEEREICLLWSFRVHLQTLQQIIINEKIFGPNYLDTLRIVSAKRDFEICDRFETIRKDGGNLTIKSELSMFNDEVQEGYKTELEQLLDNGTLETAPEEQRTLTKLYQADRVAGENELNFRLRAAKIVWWEKRHTFDTLHQRLGEMFGGDNFIVEKLEQKNDGILKRQKIDEEKWCEIFYLKFFSADKMGQIRAKFSVEMLLFFKMLEQKLDMALESENWKELRRTVAKFVDEINFGEAESEQRQQMLGHLKVISQRFKSGDFKEISELEARILENGEVHVEILGTLLKRKSPLKQKIRELSSAEFIRRAFVLLGNHGMAGFLQINRNYRALMDEMPNWYLAIDDPFFEQCEDLSNEGKMPKNYQDSEANLLVSSYLLFLSNDALVGLIHGTSDGLGFVMFDINFSAANWLFFTFVDELLLRAISFLGAKKEDFSDRLWRRWTEMVIRDTEQSEKGAKSTERVCQTFRFAISLLNCLWEEMDEERRKMLAKWLREGRWTEFLLIRSTLDKLAEGQNAKLAIDDAKLLEQFKMPSNLQLVHSLTIYRLLKRSFQFASFFCGQNLQKFNEVKNNLFTLLNSSSEFNWLERKFPFVLKIEKMNLRMRIYLYRKLIINRSWSAGSLATHARIILPLLLEELDTKIYNKNIAKFRIFEELEETLLIIKFEVFRAIESFRSVCWLMYLWQYVEGFDGRTMESTKEMPTRQMIDECSKLNAEMPIFVNIWGWLQHKHFDFLQGRDAAHNEKRTRSTEHPLKLMLIGGLEMGERTRLMKLIGLNAFNQLLNQNAHLINYGEVFSDSRLASHYLNALFRVSSDLDRYANRIAADLTIFVQWFDAEPKGAKMERVWREKKGNLAWEYDQLFDVSVENLVMMLAIYEKLFERLRNFLVAQRNAANEKVLKDGWEKAKRKAESDAAKSFDAERKMIRITVPEWVRDRHERKIRQMLGIAETPAEDGGKSELKAMGKQQQTDQKQFRETLRMGLEKSTDARLRLWYFLGMETVKEIFKLIEMEFNEKEFQFNEKQRKSEAEGMEKKEKKEEEEEHERKKKEKRKERNRKKNRREGKGGKRAKDSKEKEEKKGKEEEKEEKKENKEEKEEKKGNGEEKEEEEEKKEKGEEKEEKINNIKMDKEIGENYDTEENERKEEEEKEKNQRKERGNNEVKKESKEGTKRKAKREKGGKEQKTKGKGKSEEKKEELTEKREIGIKELQSDEFLSQKYLKFVSKSVGEGPTNSKILLELSVYANEIWQRIEALKEIGKEFQFEFWQKVENLANKWEKMEEEKVEIDQQKEIWKKIGKMRAFLKQLMANLGNGENVEEKVNETGEKEQLMQLQRNKLAKSMTRNGKTAQIWHILSKERQINTLSTIFGIEKANKRCKEGKRKEFAKYLAQWETAMAQLEMDEKMLDEFVDKKITEIPQNEVKKLTAIRKIVENLQQINLSEEEQEKEKAIFDVYYNNGINLEMEQKIEKEFIEIRQIVRKWSNNTAQLLLGGSFQLKVHSEGSDIDTLCIAPQHFGHDDFFGTQSECEGPEKGGRSDEQSTGTSLFCLFSKLPAVRSLRRIPSARVPTLRLVLRSDFEFDIVFASIPGVQTISIEEKGEHSVHIAKLIERLADKIKTDGPPAEDGEVARRMLRSLAGFHSNLKLLEMAPNVDMFRKFVLLLKRWAKSNFIYGNALGFLNGISLCVMAMKVLLLFPSASLPFLLERFFLIYSLWPFPLPIQLGKFSPDLLNWSPEEELHQLMPHFGFGFRSKLSMPIITPGYPEQNATFNVNFKTAQIIKTAIKNTLIELNKSTNKSAEEKWRDILHQQRKFSEMIQFFSVVCFASDWDLSEEFCGFVSTRLRNQLLISSANLCHVRTLRECPERIVQNYGEKIPKQSICKSWLIGMDEQNNLGNESKKMRNRNLEKELDEQIVNGYKKMLKKNSEKAQLNSAEIKLRIFFQKIENENKNLKGMDEFIYLEAKFVSKEQLKKENWEREENE
ncbi:hypothetical protein niasHS_015066 [Heterodera schachtii]|uniref:polynucleotide adenylyltransferase n=1 Tax=Heterodera schachtii TaxID=97005 RepID=A0ABD2I4Z5_HETSC